MFSTVTFVLFVSCCDAALSSWIPYGNSYLPVQVKGEYRNSYAPQYDNYGPPEYPSYPGSFWPDPWGGWRGNNVGSQGNAVSGYGNVVGSQGNDVIGYGNDVGWQWNSVDGKGNYVGSQWNSVN